MLSDQGMERFDSLDAIGDAAAAQPCAARVQNADVVMLLGPVDPYVDLHLSSVRQVDSSCGGPCAN